jgi:hypothetical protein
VSTGKWKLIAEISETENWRTLQPLIRKFITKYGLRGNESHEQMICEKDSGLPTDKRTIVGYMVYLWGIPSEMIVHKSYEDAYSRLKEIAAEATSSTHQQLYNYSVKRIVNCDAPFLDEQ